MEMSDDPSKWLRQLTENICVDPAFPDGFIAIESDGKRVARWASHPGGLVTGELREDLASFAESFPYFVRLDERGEPIRCEMCGTLVMLVPEWTIEAGAESRKPGIWEHESLRKHTMRRCEWKRANP